MLKAAAETFAIWPQVGSEGRTLLGNRISRVFTPLKSSVVLIEQEGELFVLLTSHFMNHQYRLTNILRAAVSEALGISREAVLCFSSHNHSVAKLLHEQYAFGRDESDLLLPASALTREGEQLRDGCVETAVKLKDRMQAVSVHYGKGRERRFTYNRKGRRADGTAFLMREEDRLLYGRDFVGDIDDDAFVVGLLAADGRPVVFLTHFTGHPVTAYHCDFPVVHGEFPQIACDDLSDAFAGTPAVFLQGCAGDVNARGLLALTPVEENVRNAELYGHQLGQTFVSIARTLQPSVRTDLRSLWRTVSLPFRGLPPRSELSQRRAATEAFLERCGAGDEPGTRTCDGLNFPSNMSLSYRAALIQPVQRWLQWTLSFYEQNRRHEAPQALSLRVAALRLGDVGIVGLPCEPLLGIGRQIKASSPLALTLPCGYMNDTSAGYVPDGPNCRDLDYVSAFYRYTQTQLPFQEPAGDLLASAAVAMLEEISPTLPPL